LGGGASVVFKKEILSGYTQLFLSLIKNRNMKRIVLLLIGLSFLACKKEIDEFSIVTENIESLDLPQNIVGKWRWIGSWGGWGVQAPDSTNQQMLIVNANKTYQSCKNQNCQTSEWVYGFRILIDRGKQIRDTLLVFQSLEKNSPSVLMTVRHLEQIKDTLYLGSFCNDCFDPVYVREK
jgi:hypothetical protein